MPHIDTAALEAAGRDAYQNDRPAAPAACPVVQAAIADAKVGDGTMVAVCAAWQRGWHAAADAEAAAAFAGPAADLVEVLDAAVKQARAARHATTEVTR